MAYNPSTNSLSTRSATSVGTTTFNTPALAINAAFTFTDAINSLTGVVVQSATSLSVASLNAPALTGIQMTQISGPTPNYTIVQIISPVQSWGS